ncbi:MAG: surface antigen [Lysobacterales bacterium]|jgi:surface antigen
MKNAAYLILMAVMISGCTTTQQGTSIGTVAGAGLGAIIGHQTGHRTEGALIGGVLGAGGGYAVGQKMRSKFCPVGGEHYDESVSYCPTHGVALKYKEK